jgi:Zn-dependent protease
LGVDDPVGAVVFYVVFLFSTTLHEAGHAWAAMRGGDLTAYHGGQVSIDPIPHIRREPFGMVILPIISLVISGWPFGFASAPYDAHWARLHPNRAAWMSLAGPAANLGLVLLAALLIRIGLYLDVLYAPSHINFAKITASHVSGLWGSVGYLLGVFFSLNLVLLILNILPIPPLDGSGAVPLLLSPELGER